MKSYLSLLLFFFIVSAQCDSNSSITGPKTIDLWPERDHTIQNNEIPEPSRGDSVIRISVKNPSLTVYPASDAQHPAPAVLIFPGGGYAYMAVNKEGTDVAKWLNSLGITAVLVKYSTPNKRIEAFQDGQRAVRLVRSHSKEWNIDPSRVGVIGFSAGGHLAARLSSDFSNESYPKVDEADKLSPRPDFTILMYPAYLDNDEKTAVADEIPISSSIPPTFIVQTRDDINYVHGTILYDQELEEAGVPVEFKLFESGGHGYGIWRNEYAVSNWPDSAQSWLDKIDVIK